MNSGLKFIVGALLASTAIVVTTQANAQEVAAVGGTAGQTLEVITVTAERHSSTVQTTAASISAFSMEDLQDRGVTSFAGLAQSTPGVSLKSEGPSQTEVEMRGMTSSGGNSPTVGFYLDDVPLTGPANAQNGHVVIDPSLYDLNRIEVLSGPQGTLYGASSMGGTVRLITNQPDLTAYGASAQSILSGTEGGTFNHDDNAMLNIPIVNNQLALRLVASENFVSGWIDRIVGNPASFPLVVNGGCPTSQVVTSIAQCTAPTSYPSSEVSTRGNVEAAPITAQYPHSNASQSYATHANLLWEPTSNLTIEPAFFYQNEKQNGISAYDSNPGTMATYQPYNIPEPLTDEIEVLSLNVKYSFDGFDVTSSTGQWWRRSTQTEGASENFNNPQSGATCAANNALGSGCLAGVYTPPPGEPAGAVSYAQSGPVYGHENDPSRQLSEELRFTSTDNSRLGWVAGLYFSNMYSRWNFNGTTPNFSNYMDLGTFQPATTPDWFVANSPTTDTQYAAFGDATYAITDALKADIGLRSNNYFYSFSSCISGWGSGLGAATPSCTGLIKKNGSTWTPKYNLAYTIDPDLMVYATVASGVRPGGGNPIYPTTGAFWGPAYAQYNFGTAGWPRTYHQDTVWSYEVGEKAQFFNHRLTVDVSGYYENWNKIQLEAYPGDWALNLNGQNATILGGEINMSAVLGAGFELKASTGYVREWMNAGSHWEIVPSHDLPEVTPVTADIVLSYAEPLTDKYTFTALIENSYTGDRHSLAFPYGFQANGVYETLPAYDLTNIRAGIVSGDGWNASLFANNVFNKHAQLESLFQEDEPSTAFNRIITNQPLTAGIDVTYSY